VECVEDTEYLRDQLPAMGLVAFVGDGAVLPRASGASDAPMAAGDAVPFLAPDALAATVQLPNRGVVRGLGIRQAGQQLAGHGSGTECSRRVWLAASQPWSAVAASPPQEGRHPHLWWRLPRQEHAAGGDRGGGLQQGAWPQPNPQLLRPPCWPACSLLRNGCRPSPSLAAAPSPQVPGDGRELVATDPAAVKIRAEDGRWAVCWLVPPRLPRSRRPHTFITLALPG
jgi:hypothetical protein